MADKDCDNQLSKAEFMLMVRRGDPYMKQKEIEKSFILATLGNGAVSFDAFAAWVSVRDYQAEAHALIDPLKVVWHLWNLDGDDSLSIPEFEHCIKQAFPKMKRIELLRIIRAIDEDFSGVVTQEEFGLFICPPEA
ncbi:CML23 [Symbiodinium sp. KB8]|nr:CML23 [Symbiodinium sp. KB8]